MVLFAFSLSKIDLVPFFLSQRTTGLLGLAPADGLAPGTADGVAEAAASAAVDARDALSGHAGEHGLAPAA